MTIRGSAMVAGLCLLMIVPAGAEAQPAPASGSADDSLQSRRLRGKRALQRGSVARLRNHQVDVGGKKMSIGAIAGLVFKEQDTITAELRSARSSLLSAPVVTDEVVETDTETVLVRTTRAVVTDPGGLARRHKRFKKFRRKRGKVRAAELTGDNKRSYQAWKTRLAKLPAQHPLRIAAAKGDDALLEAVTAGKGDIEISTTIAIPKKRLSVTNGQLQEPIYKNGSLDRSNKRSRRLRFDTGDSQQQDRGERSQDAQKTAKVVKRGHVDYQAKFLTGFTIGDSWEWSRSWKFPSGFFRATATAYYGVGLRVPVQITARMTPSKITVRASKDVVRSYRVQLQADTLDAGVDYYKKAGLRPDQLYRGKEFVLEAGFHLNYAFKAGWGAIKKSGHIGKSFDFGQNFKAPMGNKCARTGSECGIAVWIPSSITRTSLKIGLKKLYVKGSARAGFLLTGSGAVGVRYQSMFGTNIIKSQRKGRAAWLRHHDLVINSSAKQVLTSKLPVLGHPSTRPFGFAVSRPRYTWKLKIVPGVRVDIDIVAGKWIDKRFTAGPMWFHPLAIDLGKLSLHHHKGTHNTYRIKLGEKTFIEK